jgi:opacity protein-like surface antigen
MRTASVASERVVCTELLKSCLLRKILRSLLRLACWTALTLPHFALAQDQPSERPNQASERTIDAFLSLYGGVNAPFKTDMTIIEPGTNVTTQDLKLDRSASIGGKVGVWFTTIRPKTGIDFGLEFDVMNFRPDVQEGQVLRASGTVGGVPVSGLVTNHSDLNATLFAVNLLARLPIAVSDELPNGRLSPYVGVGGGVQRTSIHPGGGDEGVDIAPAFQALAGLKVFLVRQVALFGEYKFTHASHTFGIDPTGEIKLDVTVNHFVAGLSLHF